MGDDNYDPSNPTHETIMDEVEKRTFDSPGTVDLEEICSGPNTAYAVREDTNTQSAQDSEPRIASK